MATTGEPAQSACGEIPHSACGEYGLGNVFFPPTFLPLFNYISGFGYIGGVLYVADSFNGLIRTVTNTGSGVYVGTYAGTYGEPAGIIINGTVPPPNNVSFGIIDSNTSSITVYDNSLYILDYPAGIREITGISGSSGTVSTYITQPSGYNYYNRLCFDSSGNNWIIAYSGGQYHILKNNNATPPWMTATSNTVGDNVLIGTNMFYTTNSGNGSLLEADLVAKTVSSKFSMPAGQFLNGMVWDGSDIIYIDLTSNYVGGPQSILAYSISGNSYTTFSTLLSAGSNALALDGVGNLYVSFQDFIEIIPISTGIPALYAGQPGAGYRDGPQS